MFRSHFVVCVNHIVSQPSLAVAWHHSGGLYVVCPPTKTMGCVTMCNLRSTRRSVSKAWWAWPKDTSTLTSPTNRHAVFFYSSWQMLVGGENLSWKLKESLVFRCVRMEREQRGSDSGRGGVFMYIPLCSDNCMTVCLHTTRPLHFSAALEPARHESVQLSVQLMWELETHILEGNRGQMQGYTWDRIPYDCHMNNTSGF